MGANGRVSVAVGYIMPCVGSGVCCPHPATASSEVHAGAPPHPKRANRLGSVVIHGSDTFKKEQQPPGEKIYEENKYGDMGRCFGRMSGGDTFGDA